MVILIIRTNPLVAWEIGWLLQNAYGNNDPFRNFHRTKKFL